MNLVSIDHFDDRTTGKPKAWVTVEENGQQYTVGPHIAKPRTAKPTARRGGRPASTSANDLESLVAKAVATALKAASK